MTPVPVAAVPAPRPGRPGRGTGQSRPRLGPDLTAQLAARATPRDVWLLRMLAEHRVLTSIQVAQLAFGSQATARHRLVSLWRMRAVDRAQPFTASGSADTAPTGNKAAGISRREKKALKPVSRGSLRAAMVG